MAGSRLIIRHCAPTSFIKDGGDFFGFSKRVESLKSRGSVILSFMRPRHVTNDYRGMYPARTVAAQALAPCKSPAGWPDLLAN